MTPSSQNSSASSSRAVNPGPVARLCSGAAQDRGGNPERTGDRAHSSLLGTPAVSGSSRTGTADFSEDLIIIARIERLILLTDARKARRRHASVKGIMRRLREVTARLAGAGV